MKITSQLTKRTVTKLLRTSRLNPMVIRKTEHGEFALVLRGKSLDHPATYFASDIADARATAAFIIRSLRKGGAL